MDETREPDASELEALTRALEQDEAAASAPAHEATHAPAAESLPHADAPAELVGAGHAEHAGSGLESADFLDPQMDLGMFFSSWDLFGDSALAGAIAGAVLGFLGVYVVLRRMVFLSAALSQVASLGIVGAFFLQLSLGLAWFSPLLGALLATFVAITALTLGVSASRRDGMLGFVFLLGASGTILLGTQIVQELQDVQTLLFGTAVAVVPGDFTRLLVMGVVLGAVHLVGWRGFSAVVFDSEDANVRGLPTQALELGLLATIALAVSLSTRVLGALPTFAFSVLPGMAALRMSRNVPRALWTAALLGGLAGFLGYLFAFLFELPVGASQAFVALLTLPLAQAVHLIRTRVRHFAAP